MLRLLPMTLAIVIIVSTGIVHGIRTDRWSGDTFVDQAAQRLQLVPPSFGEWTGDDVEISESQLTQAEAVGHVSRRFVNQVDGSVVSVLIVCGRHGPIAVHPPTVCFTGSGFGLTAPEEKHVVTNKATESDHSFWVADFSKETTGIPFRIRTFWAWSDGGAWQAADNPRWTYAGSKYLYKMYVTRELGPAEQSMADDDSSLRFLDDFLPVLKQAIFQAS